MITKHFFRQEVVIEIGYSHTVIASGTPCKIFRTPSLVPQTEALPQKKPTRGRKKNNTTPPPVLTSLIINGGLTDPYKATVFIKKCLKNAGIHPGNPLKKTTAGIILPPELKTNQKHVFSAVMDRVGLRKARFIPSPLALAKGFGLPTDSPVGRLVVDFGGEWTKFYLISMGQPASGRRLPVGGKHLTESIVQYTLERYKIKISPRVAEKVKLELGSVFPAKSEKSMEVTGEDPRGGPDKKLILRDGEIRDVLMDAMEPLVLALREVFETVPPELSGDVARNGALLAGGGALLEGLPDFLRERTGLEFHIPDDPANLAVRGAMALL